MFGLGAGELFIIFVFALIFIGPKKLPELAKGLGKGIREFQKAKNDIMDEVNNDSSVSPSVADSSEQKKEVPAPQSENVVKADTEQDTEKKA